MHLLQMRYQHLYGLWAVQLNSEREGGTGVELHRYSLGLILPVRLQKRRHFFPAD